MRRKSSSMDPRFSREKGERLLRSVEEHFLQNKPYLKLDYCSMDLAQELNICYQYLSFVLNNHLGMTFKELVNTHRVAYAMELMKGPEAHLYTLQWLGQKAGFRSRTTFFRAFHRVTGHPPSEIKRSCIKAEVVCETVS